MFSALLEWMGQESRSDPPDISRRIAVNLSPGENVIGRASLNLKDPKYAGLSCRCFRHVSWRKAVRFWIPGCHVRS
jgi:hypothetical protein